MFHLCSREAGQDGMIILMGILTQSQVLGSKQILSNLTPGKNRQLIATYREWHHGNFFGSKLLENYFTLHHHDHLCL